MSAWQGNVKPFLDFLLNERCDNKRGTFGPFWPNDVCARLSVEFAQYLRGNSPRFRCCCCSRPVLNILRRFFFTFRKTERCADGHFEGRDIRVRTPFGKFDAHVNAPKHDHVRPYPFSPVTEFDVIKVRGNRVISDNRIRDFQSADRRCANGLSFWRRDPISIFSIHNRYASTPSMFYCNFYGVTTLRSNFPPE